MTNFNKMQVFSQSLQKLGSGLMQTGLTSVVLRNSRCCGGCSIFGFSTPAMMTGGLGMYATPQMLADPLGISWLPNPNMNYAMNNQYGNALAFQWGRSLAANSAMQPNMYNNQLFNNYYNNYQSTKTDNEYAGDVDINQSTQKGKEVDNLTDKMGDNNVNAEIAKFSSSDTSQAAAEYRAQLGELGKSYSAMIDSEQGNKDGKVTVDEYVKHEMSKLPSDIDANKKQQARLMAQNAFNKIDQNGDGYADWKELASTMATFDLGSDNKMDGTIEAKDYQKWSYLLGQNQSNQFDTQVRKSYKQLFGGND